MRVLTLESYWNIYLLRGYPEVWSHSRKGAKQLEAQLQNVKNVKNLKMWTKMYLQKQDIFNRKCTDGSKKIINWQMFSRHCQVVLQKSRC